jgi:hypothetical protein
MTVRSTLTLGDVWLEREVLTMFSAQAASLIGSLTALPADAPALAHTLKGSARAIAIDLNEAIVQARMVIDAILRRP